MKSLFYLSITVILITNACNQSDDELIKFNFDGKGIFICNEGNYTYGNSSLSYLDLTENKIYNDVFFKATGYPLGDVAQSVTIFGENAFITVNNSGKIYVINKNTIELAGEINGLTSPRYICFISSVKAYISDLYSPIITVFNPQNFQISGSINLQNTSEQMIYHESFVYVTSWSFNKKVFKIKSENDEVIDSLIVAYQPNSLVIDKNNFLWILSDGGNEGSEFQEFPTLTKISLPYFEIDTVLFFNTIDISPSRLCINSSKDSLFFLSTNWGSQSTSLSGIYTMSIHDIKIPEIPLIPENENSFYGLFVNPLNSEIYVTDALSYTENGLILKYSSSGKLLQTYTGGIIPGNFAFNE